MSITATARSSTKENHYHSNFALSGITKHTIVVANFASRLTSSDDLDTRTGTFDVVALSTSYYYFIFEAQNDLCFLLLSSNICIDVDADGDEPNLPDLNDADPEAVVLLDTLLLQMAAHGVYMLLGCKMIEQFRTYLLSIIYSKAWAGLVGNTEIWYRSGFSEDCNLLPHELVGFHTMFMTTTRTQIGTCPILCTVYNTIFIFIVRLT
ncbi:hypothetical protein ACJX0J_010190, partial [Zea mays]